MSGSPNTMNRLPLPVFFSSPAMCRVWVHLGFEDRQRGEAVQFGSVRVEGERAGDQHVEPRLRRLTRCGYEIDARKRAELRSDQDGGAPLYRLLVILLDENAFGADILARPTADRIELDPVSLWALLDAS